MARAQRFTLQEANITLIESRALSSWRRSESAFTCVRRPSLGRMGPRITQPLRTRLGSGSSLSFFPPNLLISYEIVLGPSIIYRCDDLRGTLDLQAICHAQVP